MRSRPLAPAVTPVLDGTMTVGLLAPDDEVGDAVGLPLRRQERSGHKTEECPPDECSPRNQRHYVSLPAKAKRGTASAVSATPYPSRTFRRSSAASCSLTHHCPMTLAGCPPKSSS